ncbi:enoyl-CoA hydratase/isomerase family protein [Paralcaligenes ginsengisoli]
MASNEVLVARSGDVAVVTLNKPERYNAWTRAMRMTVAEVLGRLGADDSVKAIVVTGTGDKGFCTGQDFSESQNFKDDQTSRAWLYEIKDFYDLIRRIEKPIVAALNGIAAGSGFQFALLMDFRIAHEDVTMGQPEINNGIPSVVGPWVMSERISLTQTVDLALTGRLVGSSEAKAMGLINKIVPRDQVLPTAVALAAELGSKPPVALRFTKRAFRQRTQAGFDLAFQVAEEAQISAFASGEPQRCMEEFFRIREARKAG